jgi:hypothetical protein
MPFGAQNELSIYFPDERLETSRRVAWVKRNESASCFQYRKYRNKVPHLEVDPSDHITTQRALAGNTH